MEPDIKLLGTQLNSLLKKYDSESYQNEWDKLVVSILLAAMQLAQLRSFMQLPCPTITKIIVPQKMYSKLFREFSIKNPNLKDEDGRFKIKSQLGDLLYIYSSDKALENMEVYNL